MGVGEIPSLRCLSSGGRTALPHESEWPQKDPALSSSEGSVSHARLLNGPLSFLLSVAQAQASEGRGRASQELAIDRGQSHSLCRDLWSVSMTPRWGGASQSWAPGPVYDPLGRGLCLFPGAVVTNCYKLHGLKNKTKQEFVFSQF